MLANFEPLVRRDMPNILLSHNPNTFNRAAELGMELTLSGHTHGGQVKVEILDVSLSPARFITDYIAGLYHRPLLMPDVAASAWAKPSSSCPTRRTAWRRSTSTAAWAPSALRCASARPPEITHIVLRRV